MLMQIVGVVQVQRGVDIFVFLGWSGVGVGVMEDIIDGDERVGQGILQFCFGRCFVSFGIDIVGFWCL